MARNANVAHGGDAWVQMTADDATVVVVQPKAASLVVMATAGATPPSNYGVGLEVAAGEAASITLATAFPGVTSPTRLYGWSAVPVTVFVSHD